MTVVTFPGNPKKAEEEPKEVLWACNCGNTTFTLKPGQVAICANCGVQARGDEPLGAWTLELEPPVPDKPEEVERYTTVVNFNDNAATARHLAKVIADNADDVAVVIVAFEDGETRVFGVIDGGEQREWLERRLDTARALLTGGSKE